MLLDGKSASVHTNYWFAADITQHYLNNRHRPGFHRVHDSRPFRPSHRPCDQTCPDTSRCPCYESTVTSRTTMHTTKTISDCVCHVMSLL